MGKWKERIKCYKCGADNPLYRIDGSLNRTCEHCGATLNISKYTFEKTLKRYLTGFRKSEKNDSKRDV